MIKTYCLCFMIQFGKKMYLGKHIKHIWIISLEPGQAFGFLKLHISLPLPLKNHHQAKHRVLIHFFLILHLTQHRLLEATQEVEKLVLQTKAGKHELSGSTIK